jgi:hypothetical protein
MQNIEKVLSRLAGSKFRARFRLGKGEQKYLQTKGLPVVLEHAADFIEKRLAPAHPEKDGKQTPWRGHPVFIAQHATATCCRGCLEKWHGIARGQELDEDEQRYVVQVIEAWLRGQETTTVSSNTGQLNLPSS